MFRMRRRFRLTPKCRVFAVTKRNLKGVYMSEQELINEILELSKTGIGFPLILWGAYLLKRYVISGHTRKYFAMQRREFREIRKMSLRIDALLKALDQPDNKGALDE